MAACETIQGMSVRPAATTNAHRATWDEICARYPDEWVVLVDVDWIDEDGEFRSAAVFDHGKNRDETLRRADPVKSGYREFAHTYTGDVRAPRSSNLQPGNLQPGDPVNEGHALQSPE